MGLYAFPLGRGHGVRCAQIHRHCGRARTEQGALLTSALLLATCGFMFSTALELPSPENVAVGKSTWQSEPDIDSPAADLWMEPDLAVDGNFR